MEIEIEIDNDIKRERKRGTQSFIYIFHHTPVKEF